MLQIKQENSIEPIIRCSGIFKLNQKDEMKLPPKGIFKLTANKDLSKKATNYIPYKSHVMKNMITDLAIEIKEYLQAPHDYNSLQGVLDDFEMASQNLGDFILKDLKPRYADFITKARKRLKKHLTPYDKKMTRWDTKESLCRVVMIGSLRDIFQKYTGRKYTDQDFSSTDIDFYVTHLLIGCGIETGNYKTVYRKNSRLYYRHKNPYRKNNHPVLRLLLFS